MSLEGLQSVSYCPPFPIGTAKVGYCPKSWPVLFTIITLKSDSWFRSTGDFCGRLYRSRVLMSSSEAVANGVVSGVRGKRPRWDYHSHGGLRKVLPAQALGVRATHFRGQGKLSNEQPGLSLPSFKDYTMLHLYNKAPVSIQTYVMQKQKYSKIYFSYFWSNSKVNIQQEKLSTLLQPLYYFSSLSNFSTVVLKSHYRGIDRDFTKCLTVIKRPQMRPGLTDW